MTKSTIKMLSLLAFIAAIPLSAPSANAQGAKVLEEVIVTSRKREESLLDVPLSVTAFSADTIEKMSLDELPDLVDFSPGFHYSEHSVGRGGRFNRRLIFRGMNPRTDRQTRQGASVFIDGAPMLGSEIGSTENFERIEVIKGPQSAYFGRSTFSGAVNVITKTPGNEWAGRVSAKAARFGTSDFSAQIEGPIVEDKLTFRFSGSQFDTDGEYQNQGNPTERLGAESTTDFALSLFATPTDQFSAKLRLHYWTDQDGPSIGVAITGIDNPDLLNCAPGGGTAAGGGQWFCGEVPFQGTNFGIDTTLTPALRNSFYSPAMVNAFIFDDVPFGFGLERHAQEVSLVMDYEFANGMTLTSITAAHENEYASFEDFDRRVTAQFGIAADTYNLTLTSNKDFSQEVRLSSPDEGRLRWMVGASYTEIEAELQGFSQFGPVRPNPAQAVSTFDPQTTALFASAGWDINDQFTLSVEARSQRDKVVEGTRRPTGTVEFQETFNSFTPRVILDYKPNDDTTLYVVYAEGTNPGQFNAGLANRTQAELDQIAAQGGGGINVNEEELTNIEFGIKSRLWDGRAQVSAAVYFSDWSAIVAPEIIPIINAAGLPENVQVNSTGGQADLSGLELEGSVLLSDNVTLDGTFAYNKSDIKDFESPDALTLLGNRTIDGFGNAFSRYPETSGTLSLTYEGQLTSNYDWYARGDLIYRGSTWQTNANLTETAPVTTVNLRIGFQTDAWLIEAFGTNIFDEEGYSNLQNFPDLSGLNGGGARIIFAGLVPRPVFGVRARLDF